MPDGLVTTLRKINEQIGAGLYSDGPFFEVSKPNFCKRYTRASIEFRFSYEPSQKRGSLQPATNRCVASQRSECLSPLIRTIHCGRHSPVVSVTRDKKQMKYDTRPFMRRESQNILGMFRQGRGIFPRHVSTPHKPPCVHFSPPHTVISTALSFRNTSASITRLRMCGTVYKTLKHPFCYDLIKNVLSTIACSSGSENKQRLFHCTPLTDWFL